MSKTFDFDPVQHKLEQTLINSDEPGGINGSGTGVGKTKSAVATALGRGAKRVLIIGKPNTFEEFEEALEILSGQKLRYCGNQRLRSDIGAAQAKANKDDCAAGKDGWFFTSRELFQRESWRKRTVKHRSGKTSQKNEAFHYWDGVRPFDMIIYDEMQMAASPTSKSQKSLALVRATFKLGQSADWMGGDLGNQYHVAKMFWPEWMSEQYSTFAEWRDENCVTAYDHFAFGKKKIVGEQWKGFFAATMPLYVRIASPIAKPPPEPYYIDLLPAERRLYTELRKNLAAEVGNELFVVDDPKQLFMRLREAALGTFRPVEVMRKRKRADNGRVEEVPGQTVAFDPGAPSSTVDAIKAIMAEYPGEHVIVLSHSKKFAIKAAADLGGMPYTGDQTDQEKSEAKRAFLAGETKLLFGTSAIAEGMNGLQAVCRIAIIASRPGIHYMTEQFIGRVARRGQEREVVVYELYRRDTLDTKIPKGKKLNKGIIERAVQKELMLGSAKALPSR